jgi:O-antigen/teichoic acid export membrane protein
MIPATQRWIGRLWANAAWSDGARARQGVSHGFWVMCDQGVVSLASFVSAVIVGRICGQYELGIYSLAVTMFWLAAGIPNALVWTPYTSHAARLTSGRREVYAGSVTLHTVLIAVAIAAVALLVGIVPLPVLRRAEWLAPMCLALVPFTILMIVREHVRRLHLADLRTRELVAIDVPIAVAQVAVLMALAYVNRLSATTALLAVAATCSLAALWLARNAERFDYRPRRAVVHWSFNQRFGRWLLFVTFAWLLGDASYRWMVGSIHGLEALGRFAAAQSIVLALNPVLLTLNNLAQAWSAREYARGGRPAVKQFALRTTLLVGVGAGLGFAVLAVCGGTLVRLMYGGEFAGLGRVAAALALGMFAHAMFLPVDAALVALRRGNAMLLAAVVRLVLAVGCGVMLVWWRGLEGVGYAMAISSVASAAIEWYALVRSGEDASEGRAA